MEELIKFCKEHLGEWWYIHVNRHGIGITFEYEEKPDPYHLQGNRYAPYVSGKDANTVLADLKEAYEDAKTSGTIK
jgi:hypothetical protein